MAVDPVEALDLTIRLAAELDQVMRHDLEARGLNLSEAATVFLLHHQGPMVQRDLSDALGRTPRHVTSIVDALEEKGHVARGPHPSDRRAWLVSVTAAGSRVAMDMEAGRQRSAQLLFSELPATQLKGYVATITHVLASLESVVRDAGVVPPPVGL